MSASRIPVIIGIGELTDKSKNPGEGLEPLALLERCVAAADADAGGGWVSRIDTIRVVNQVSWPYRDLPGLLARRLRIRAAEGFYGPVGGESPVRLLVDAAQDVASGHSEVALLCGAEAMRSMMACAAAGQKPAWGEADPAYRTPRAEDFVSRSAARHGLLMPVDVYPLYENACRAAWGQSFAEAQAESGTIFARNSEAAAENPHAWSARRMSAEEIVTPSKDNRPVSWPYQKFMVANLSVNQGAAVLLTHRDRALQMGIAEDRLVYVWGGAGAHEPYDFLQRHRYDEAPALEQVLRRTLEINRLQTRDIDLFELYSCFPIVPKLARRALGLPADAATSVCGGLTLFGGPGNDYMTHAITAMVRALRAGRGQVGLLHGNGEYVTKHHAAIIARRPPPEGVAVANLDLQPEVDARQAAAPELIEDYEGPASIETYTVGFHPSGRPNRGTVIARTPQGHRVLARVTEAEAEALAFLMDPAVEPIGRMGAIYDGGDGWKRWSLQLPAQRALPAVLFERPAPHVAVVTLNRPERRNAVNGAVARLMAQYVQRIEEDPEIRVAILTAAGGQVFCAGADLAEAAAGRGHELSDPDNGFAGFVNARRRKPWIAAVTGAALGGGTELALACDLVVAAENARFGLPEVKRSLIAGAGGLYRLPRAIGPRIAMELVLTGEAVDARRALELGLVNRCVADGEVLAEALKLAGAIAENAPLAVQTSRLVAARAYDMSDAALSELSVQQVMPLMSTEDFVEGTRAFLEKRKPVWKGR